MYQKLGQFRNKVSYGSDKRATILVCDAFKDAISKGNVEAILVLDRLCAICDRVDGPKINFQIASKNEISNWRSSTTTLTLAVDESKETVFHELSHALFDKVSEKRFINRKYNQEETFKQVRENAARSATDNKRVTEWINNVQESRYSQEIKSEYFENVLKNKGLKSFDEYVKQIEDQFNSMLNNKDFGKIKKILIDLGYDEKSVEEVLINGITAEIFIKNRINTELREYVCESKMYECENEVCDIIDAMFSGTGKDSNGNKLNIFAYHGANYYNSANSPETAKFNEMLAQYTSIRLSGRYDLLNDIKLLFGDQIYHLLELAYSRFIY